MSKQETLIPWVYQAVKDAGGEASVIEVAKYIWKNHRPELEKSDLLYTWQYDMRWAAQKLRDQKKFSSTAAQGSRKWKLASA
jgi:hypothetical protein